MKIKCPLKIASPDCKICSYSKDGLCDHPNSRVDWTARQEEYEKLFDMGFRYKQIIRLINLRRRYLIGKI